MFKRKDIREIERIAAAKEGRKVEAHYLEEMNKLRRAKDAERDRLESELLARHEIEKKKLIVKFSEKIREIRIGIDKKDKQIKDAQKAWDKYKEYANRLFQFSDIISQQSMIARDSGIRIYQQFETINESLQRVVRFNDKKAPEIERLLSLDDSEDSN